MDGHMEEEFHVNYKKDFHVWTWGKYYILEGKV